MNRKIVKSLAVTILCALLILVMGYIGIVKGGSLLLGNEQKPQKAEFENTSSNVFYSKIEDDIQLFPWNYYGQNEKAESIEEIIGDSEYIGVLEEVVQCMEAYCCGVEKQTIETVYQQRQSSIMSSLKTCETEYGYIFFYQDILNVQGSQYQVKLALSEYSILSFSCIEYREKDIRTTQEWDDGREMLTKMLERYQEQIVMQTYEMLQYPYGGYPYMDGEDKEKLVDIYIEIYMQNMKRVNQMLEGKYEAVEYDTVEGKIQNAAEKNSTNNFSEDNANDFNEEGEYSYQVIELNDMILLLIQGEYNMGLFFDPVRQEFCGFNYF